MNIASISINRPVLASVLSIMIVLFGLVSFGKLGLREYPSVDPPIVTVTTTYTGANADIIESQITEPLETSINGISGIRTINSTSSDGRSIITVEFNLNASMEAATNDVRDRVSRAVKNLPSDVDPPVIVKSDADSDPIIIMSVVSEKRDLLELTDFGNNILKERLQTITGISEIRIFGEKKYSMKLLLDPNKMAAYSVTPTDIRNALNRENIELPSGRIEGYQTELTIRTFGRLTTEEDFNNLILYEQNNTIIRLRDVGIAMLLPENERTLLRGNNGIPMIALALIPQPGSSHIAIADEFNKRIELLKKELPSDISLTVTFDTTINIRKSIKEVEETILIAFLLVVIIIFLFLRHWKTTLIPIVAIPISLIGSFSIMYISGFTINILTLLGIVLATGLVVDDAIVVLENIYKKIEQGETPVKAGHKGSHEIIFAIISTTITLVAVFVPIIFISGITGKLFREFAIVVSGSVIISAFVSLTLTPMMSAHLLKKTNTNNKLFLKSERFFEGMTNLYQHTLKSFIKKRWLAIVIMIVTIIIIVGLGMLIPSELAPTEDKSRIRIMTTAPEGTSYESMSDYMATLISYVDTIKEKDVLISLVAPGMGAVNTGFIRLGLTPPDTRKKSQQDITDELNQQLKQFNFSKAFATQEQTIGRNSGLPVQIVIQAPNFEQLKLTLPGLLDKIQSDKTFQVVDVNLKFNKPELKVEIDREKAKVLGLSVKDIAENIQLFFSGQRYGYYINNNKQYMVIGQADREDRDEPSDILSIYVRNSRGELIQLGNVLKFTEQSSPPQLFRYNRYVCAIISAQPSKGISLGEGITTMQEITKENLPVDFSTSLTGTSRDFAESSSSIFYAFLFALVLIYLVLAAQFESFRDPLIIMFTLPLAIGGAVLSLYIFNQSLNIFSEIGIIVLIGIVTKNGILIVEFANQRRNTGLSINEAVIDAATHRLRPILMTSMATILGALPIALALGAAAKSRVPMGITIIGGLLFSLFLTLYVIPAIYTYLSKPIKNAKKH